jgi:F420-non-reducing hydrogenase iron-sulfur subunit
VTEKNWSPKIVVFLCNWCSYAAADLAGVGRIQYPADVRIIRVPCTGRMNPKFILSALRSGADGILVSGCHPGDCHYLSGNYMSRRRFILFKKLLEYVGIEEGRVHFTWISAAEGEHFAEVIKTVTETVEALGPSKHLNKKIQPFYELSI